MSVDVTFRPCHSPSHAPGALACVCGLPEELSPLGCAAVRWAERGYAVFPCRARTKSPITKAGSDGVDARWGATPDREITIRRWLAYPDANIGCACEESDLWMSDVDGEVGRATWAALTANREALPDTMIVTTGREDGGGHRWWKGCPGIRTAAGQLGPSVDTRGVGGMGVLPPSVHKSGAAYRLENAHPPAAAPAWLVEHAARKPERPTAAAAPPTPSRGVMSQLDDAWLRVGDGGSDAQRVAGMLRAACDRIRSAPEGTRNDTVNSTCFALGGFLDAYGVTVDLVAPELEAAAIDAQQKPAAVRRALEDGRAHPRPRLPDRPAPDRVDGAWDESAPPPEDAPEPAWVVRLREAAASGDVQPLFADDELLRGIHRPGAHAGAVEAALVGLPHVTRQSLRRAGKHLSGTRRAGGAATKSSGAVLPVLVQHGPTWWVLDGDRYLQVAAALAAVEIGRLHKIDTCVNTESGSRYMTSTEVYGLHGVTARRLRWTYDSTEPTWDPIGRVLTVPGARVCAGPARWSERCDRWLSLLVPARQHDKLLDWLATSTDLSRPTSSPQFRGPGSTGKGMLIAALVVLLGGRTDYRHAVGEFNAGLIHGPLVTLDEGIAESNPDAFRSLTGNREHQVVEKGRMAETLVGCPRVVVTSNEPDPLRLGRQELSLHSEHALGWRILVFDVEAEAGEYLAEVGGWDATAEWCTPTGELVCHLRWLAENRRVVPGNRFLVEGDGAKWVADAHLRVGTGALIVQAFAAYRDLEAENDTGQIRQPQPFMYDLDDPTIVGVSVRGLQDNWPILMGTQEKIPSNVAFSKSLRAMSGQADPERWGPKNDRGPRLYTVEKSKLLGGDDDQDG